jgi:hypothetical protein
MTPIRLLLAVSSLLALTSGSIAQDYAPFSRFCVVCGGEARPGFTAQYVHDGTKYVVGFFSSPCRTKFLQSPGEHFTHALAAFKAGNPKKEKKVAPDATGPCDLKRIVKAPFCASCDRELARDDMLANKTCKRCENKPSIIEYCLKMADAEDRARIRYRCEHCPATGEVEPEFKHDAGCKPKIGSGLKKVCFRSGMAPHATDKK